MVNLGTMEKVVHPAGVLGPKEIQRLQASANEKDPVRLKGIQQLRAVCDLAYRPRALANVDIAPYGKGVGHDEWTGDCMQCYQQALLFLIEGKAEARAKKAVEIMSAWCDKCISFGGSNAPLEMGWGSAALFRAAELLKHTWSGWGVSGVEVKLGLFLNRIVLPVLKGRYAEIAKWKNNWVLTLQEALLQIALYQNDLKAIAWVREEFTKSVGECLLPCGTCTETKRDQIHAQFQFGSIVQICEMFWHQGVDLYDILEGRIAKCLECQAGILSGKVPPGLCASDLKDVWFMPCIWDIAYHHYVVRRKRSMPEMAKILQNKRPEKMSFQWGPAWTHYVGAA